LNAKGPVPQRRIRAVKKERGIMCVASFLDGIARLAGSAAAVAIILAAFGLTLGKVKPAMP